MKAELDSKFTTSNLVINTLVSSSSVELGGIYRLGKSVDNKTLSIELCSLNSVSNYNIWWSWFSTECNVDATHWKVYVDKTDMFLT